MKGSQESLTTVVVKGWPTPNAADSLQGGTTQGNRKDPNLSIAVHGHPAPASSSTDGSRLELWATPRANKTEGYSSPEFRPTLDQQVKSWPTPRVHEHMEPPHQWQARNIKKKAENPKLGTLDKPLGTMVMEHQKNIDKLDQQAQSWPTPVTADSIGFPRDMAKRLKDDRQTRDPEKRGNYKMDLKDQVGVMDSGAHRGKPDTLHSQMKVQAVGKLNPRWVETLMGLPVGWTMPSCASPVTIGRMSSDCSVTVLSQQQQSGPSAS